MKGRFLKVFALVAAFALAGTMLVACGGDDKKTETDDTAATSQIKGIADLEGKVVVTQADSAALEVLEGDMADVAATFDRLDQVADYNSAFMKLESGQADAVVCDLSMAQYQMAANPDAFVMLDERLSEEHYGVGFKLGDEALADQVTETLLDMYEDGTVEEILSKYADDGVSIENWLLNEKAVEAVGESDTIDEAEAADEEATDDADEGAEAADDAADAIEDAADDATDDADEKVSLDKLIVGFDAEYPPYGYIDSETGDYVGVDLDLAAEVAKRNGWEFEAMPIDWDAKDAKLNQGDITCIWNGFTIEGREDKYAFTTPYMLNAQVVVVRAEG